MTLKELGDLVIWAGGVALALTAIIGLVHITVVRPLKHWLKEQIATPLKETEKSLKTSNGQSAGQYIENSSNMLDKIEKEISNLSGQLNVTNTLALETQRQVSINTARIDRHLVEDHNNVSTNP